MTGAPGVQHSVGGNGCGCGWPQRTLDERLFQGQTQANTGLVEPVGAGFHREIGPNYFEVWAECGQKPQRARPHSRRNAGPTRYSRCARRDLTPHRHGRHSARSLVGAVSIRRFAATQSAGMRGAHCAGTGAAGTPTIRSATRAHQRERPHHRMAGSLSLVRPEGFEPPAY